MKRLSLILVFTALALSAQARSSKSLTLAWDPNPEREVAGYIFYERIGRRYFPLEVIERSREPTYTAEKLKKGTHYFSVTAYDHQGVESDLSNEIAVTIGRNK